MSTHPRRGLLRAVIGGSVLALVVAPLTAIGSAARRHRPVTRSSSTRSISTAAAYRRHLPEQVRRALQPDRRRRRARRLDRPVPLGRGDGGFSGVIALSGSIQPGGTYLVSGNSNAANGAATPDAGRRRRPSRSPAAHRRDDRAGVAERRR